MHQPPQTKQHTFSLSLSLSLITPSPELSVALNRHPASIHQSIHHLTHLLPSPQLYERGDGRAEDETDVRRHHPDSGTEVVRATLLRKESTHEGHTSWSDDDERF